MTRNPARSSLATLGLLLGLTGCAATAGATAGAPAALPGPWQGAPQEPVSLGDERVGGWHWEPGAALLQGYLGVSSFEHVSVEGAEVDGDDGDLDHLPLIGGGGQWKLGGERVDLGLEGLIGFSGRADAEAFAIGSGGAVVALDVDLLLFELYGGPFASVTLGDRLRLYGAAGPLLQFADYEQSGGGFDDDGSGFGTGWYARTGFEFVMSPSTLIGLGVRWSDSRVDLSGDLGDLELQGLQALFTVSRGF